MSINSTSPLLQAKIKTASQNPKNENSSPSNNIINQQGVCSSKAASALASQLKPAIIKNTDQTKIVSEVLHKSSKILQTSKEKFNNVKRIIDLVQNIDNGTLQDGENTLICSKNIDKAIEISGKNNARIHIFDGVSNFISYEEQNPDGTFNKYIFNSNGSVDSVDIGEQYTNNENGNKIEHTYTIKESFAYENDKLIVYNKDKIEKCTKIILDKSINKEDIQENFASGLCICFDQTGKVEKYLENAYFKSHSEQEDTYH